MEDIFVKQGIPVIPSIGPNAYYITVNHSMLIVYCSGNNDVWRSWFQHWIYDTDDWLRDLHKAHVSNIGKIIVSYAEHAKRTSWCQVRPMFRKIFSRSWLEFRSEQYNLRVFVVSMMFWKPSQSVLISNYTGFGERLFLLNHIRCSSAGAITPLRSYPTP